MYRYLVAERADNNAYKAAKEKISDKLTDFSLADEKVRGEESRSAVYENGSGSQICVTVDYSAGLVEVVSDVNLPFFGKEEHIENDTGTASYSLKANLWIEAAFLIMLIIMGALNSDSISFGWMSGGLDGLFDRPLEFFLKSLPFAAVYIFSYRPIKERTGVGGLHARIIQCGGIVTVCAVPICFLLIFLNVFPAFPFAVLLLLICSVHLVFYGMLTAIAAELGYSLIKSKMGR